MPCSQDSMRNTIEVNTLSPQKAEAYWNIIRTKGLTIPHGDHLAQVGHPVEIKEEFLMQITDGARASHRIILDEIRKVNGITEFMRQTPVTFGPYNLNSPDINQQLANRLDQGYGLPFLYDLLITRESGELVGKVIEIQTGIGYETIINERLQAAGYPSDDARTRLGGGNPATLYASLSERFANGEPIVVMDADPFDSTRIDKIGMAQLMGEENDLPMSPLDIIGKDEKGYYYNPYIIDPQKPFSIKRNDEGNPVKDTTKKKYVNNILARMGQFDLDLLWDKLQDDPHRAEFIAKFFTDSSLNWIIHPNWQHIGDKRLLPLIKARLLSKESPLADQFVQVYGSGEKIVEPGIYLKKPTTESYGNGISREKVDTSNRRVEDGFIYQRLIVPAAIPLNVPGRLAANMRRASQKALQARDIVAGDELRTITGQVEIRLIIPPYWNYNEEVSGRLMTRLAPRWTSPDSDELVRAQTNGLMICDALHAYLDPKNAEEHIYYPYGLAPAIVIFDTTNGK